MQWFVSDDLEAEENFTAQLRWDDSWTTPADRLGSVPESDRTEWSNTCLYQVKMSNQGRDISSLRSHSFFHTCHRQLLLGVFLRSSGSVP